MFSNSQQHQTLKLSDIKDAPLNKDVLSQLKDSGLTFSYELIQAKDLLPSQTELDISKSIKIALSMMLDSSYKVGGDLNAIVSNDNYMMDGHHRWLATYLCDSNAYIKCLKIDLEASKLITALNIITHHIYERSGQKGNGDLQLIDRHSANDILVNFASIGFTDNNGSMSAEEVRTRLSRIRGALKNYETGIAILLFNADRLTKQVKHNAFDRIDMPVINGNEIEDAANLIATKTKTTNMKFQDRRSFVNESAAEFKGFELPVAPITVKSNHVQKQTDSTIYNIVLSNNAQVTVRFVNKSPDVISALKNVDINSGVIIKDDLTITDFPKYSERISNAVDKNKPVIAVMEILAWFHQADLLQ